MSFILLSYLCSYAKNQLLILKPWIMKGGEWLLKTMSAYLEQQSQQLKQLSANNITISYKFRYQHIWLVNESSRQRQKSGVLEDQAAAHETKAKCTAFSNGW